ncbi:hypothetical protein A2U01_0112009, partial [Trifolium medium]|nr:hypothetical protein [Trifolium medium]
GSPRELWESAGMWIEEEYSPKREMRTEMGNILNGGTRSGKVPSAQSHSIDIPISL